MRFRVVSSKGGVERLAGAGGSLFVVIRIGDKELRFGDQTVRVVLFALFAVRARNGSGVGRGWGSCSFDCFLRSSGCILRCGGKCTC